MGTGLDKAVNKLTSNPSVLTLTRVASLFVTFVSVMRVLSTAVVNRDNYFIWMTSQHVAGQRWNEEDVAHMYWH